jgi:hypothetical protein
MQVGATRHQRCHVAQERKDLEISRLYLNVAIERFNKAAIEDHADGAEVFRRIGRRYISEAELYDATLRQKSARRLALLNCGGA